jgi:vacuolar-type H+-ATPase subunit I/STV1
VVYLKKIEGLEKQEYMLEREIKQVKGEIEELRVKRKGCEETAMSTVSSRCSSAILAREGARGKIDVLRKKIDKENEKAKKVMG